MSAPTKGPTGHVWSYRESDQGGGVLLRGDETAPLKERHPQSHLQVVPLEDCRLISLAPEMADLLRELEARPLGCPVCYALIGEVGETHTPDCRLGTLLKRLP